MFFAPVTSLTWIRWLLSYKLDLYSLEIPDKQKWTSYIKAFESYHITDRRDRNYIPCCFVGGQLTASWSIHLLHLLCFWTNSCLLNWNRLGPYRFWCINYDFMVVQLCSAVILGWNGQTQNLFSYFFSLDFGHFDHVEQQHWWGPMWIYSLSCRCFLLMQSILTV